ncbi:MAG TPA: type IV pili twitching motility protein PilT, partial [Candidatus Omnitrophica bacterium]|nr:type IV pili twitching motility protein PilT [Candidatus Omnitrophota bacterium]
MNEKGIDLETFLTIMVKKNASDFYFKVGSLPHIRTGGVIEAISDKEISSKDMEALIHQVMDEKQLERFKKQKELDLAYNSSTSERFRINVFFQKGEIGMVIREVKRKIATFEELNLPKETLQKLSMEPRGMVLVTGPAGCGKSTTIAAMIEYISQNREA